MKDKIFFLELGDECNNNCIFCSAKYRPNKKISSKEAKEKIVEAKKKGFSVIQFSGGEPTIRKDIVALIRFAKKNRFSSISLATNGRLFYYEKFTKDIISAGCNNFAVSLHGHKPKIHDACTRTPNSFKHTTKGLKNILSHNKQDFYVKINLVLNKINIPYLGNFIDKINEEFKKIDLINLIYANPIGEVKKNPFLLFKIKDFAFQIKGAIEKSKIPVFLFDIPPCTLKNDKHIERKNNTYNRLDSSYSIEKGLSHLRTKFDFCQKCKFDQKCNGAWKTYAENYGNAEFSPIV